MDNYHVLDLIGEGSFGKVYKGRKKFTGQVVALKFIPKVGRSDKDLKNLKREIEIMRGLQHENIVEMFDSFETEKEVVAVTDYGEGELFQILEDDGNLPEEQVRSIAGQLVSALYYLHSHRILHRDMKPQNILLGKGGVVKLCDFGFARAMSINTLVLTSIKGTPLYMSPELVEEKPYDHTADLWALGCILYELFTGTPPFYTNSIFQLVSLIIKDPVKWPKNMSQLFKDFLQGLLTKNPRNRLQWPELLSHQFVFDIVKVSEADKCMQSPFTQPPTASMVFAKEQQTKEKAHPPGASKILSKARRKAAEEEKKTARTKQRSEAGTNDQRQGGAGGADTDAARAPITSTPALEEDMLPTPRPDRISTDYDKECPAVEVECRKQLHSGRKASGQNIENVKLDGEEADSDDEWQSYVDITDPSADPEPCLALLADQIFVNKLTSRLLNVRTQTMDGLLDGAAKLRAVLRVITNLITLKCDVNSIQEFLKTVNIPVMSMTLIDQIIDSSNVRQQPWCQQILLDLVVSINAYFASEIIWNKDTELAHVNEYIDHSVEFMAKCPKLFKQKIDEDMKLQEQVLLCIIYVCETMERCEHQVADTYFSAVANKCGSTLEVLLKATMLDKQALLKLKELTQNDDVATQRVMEMNALAVAALAALSHFPHETDNGIEGKRKVAHYLSQLLCDKRFSSVTPDLCELITREDTCSNALKVLYAACQMSVDFCKQFSADEKNIANLVAILQGKIELADMELNSIVETVLHLLSTNLVQLQHSPASLVSHTDILVTFFMESQIASHTAASALLFSQLIHCGHMTIQVQPEDVLMAALSCFTDLTQILTRCPFDYGIFDGTLLLMCQLLMKAEGEIAKAIMDMGLWGILWHRLVQMLQVRNPDSNQPIHDIETGADLDTVRKSTIYAPDFGLLSPQGLIAALQLATSVFTKESYQCVPALGKKDSVISLTLMHLIDVTFLDQLSTSRVIGTSGRQLAGDVVLECCQILCFPYAIDINEQLVNEINNCLYAHQCVRKILESSMKYLDTDQLDIIFGLVARLVLGEFAFVDQFVRSIRDLEAASFVRLAMQKSRSPSMLCDLVSVCSHLARSSPDYLDTVIDIIKGDKGDYHLLRSCMKHHSCVIRSRACNLMGNMMKFDDRIYDVVSQHNLAELITSSLSDEDPNVLKGACYAIGNAAFHSDALYEAFRSSITKLVQLLRSNNAKIRGHAASALGNLALHNDSLVQEMVKQKASEGLLEVACHDGQYYVQESALTALRVLINHDHIKQCLLDVDVLEKLTSVSEAATPRPTSGHLGTPRSARSTANAIRHHCQRLIQQLGAPEPTS